MNASTIPPVNFETVRDVLVEQLGVNPERVKPESHLYGDLGADSLDLVEIVMAFEDEFAIDISDEEAEKIETVQQIIDHLRVATGTAAD